MEANVSVEEDAALGDPISADNTIEAMQRLLDRVTTALETGESLPTRTGDEPVAVHHIATELYGLIERIRAQYRRLADREIARAFRAVTSSAQATASGTGGAIRVTKRVENLILGGGGQPPEPPNPTATADAFKMIIQNDNGAAKARQSAQLGAKAPRELVELGDDGQAPQEVAAEPTNVVVSEVGPAGEDQVPPMAEPAPSQPVALPPQATGDGAQPPTIPPEAAAAEPEPEEPDVVIEPSDEPVPYELPEGVFDGIVRLTVFSHGNMQRVVKFVDALGQKPQFTVLRMTGNPQRDAAEIDVRLREPTPFVDVLQSMGHVAQPEESTDEGTPVLAVRLGAAA